MQPTLLRKSSFALWLLLLPIAGPITGAIVGEARAASPSSSLLPQSADDKAEYARRYRAIKKGDAEAYAKLAVWCKERNLKTYANLCIKKALKADPQNKTANEALGNVFYEGKWMTPDQVEMAKANAAEAKINAAKARAAKAARSKGTPLVPRGEDTLRAAIPGSFAAGAADAKKLSAALVDFAGLEESDCGAARSPHIRIVVTGPEDEAKKLCEVGEFVYRKLSWITFGKVDSRRFGPWGGVMEFVLADDPELESSLEMVQKRWPALVPYNDFKNMPREVRKNGLEFVDFLDPPVHLHWNPSNRASTVANSTGRAVVAAGMTAKFIEPRLGGGDRPNSMMNWLLEGAGVWSSLEAVGLNDLYRIDGARYAGDELIKKGTMIPWCDIAHEIATKRTAEGVSARTFPQICRSKLRTWTRGDLVMSFALFDWLVRDRQEEYRKLVRILATKSFREGFLQVFGTADEKKRADEAVRAKNDNKLMEAFDMAAKRFDEDWRDWAGEAYEIGGSAYRKFADAPFRVADAVDDGAGKAADKKKGDKKK